MGPAQARGLAPRTQSPVGCASTIALFSAEGIVHLLFRVPSGALNVALLLMALAAVGVEAPPVHQRRSRKEHTTWKAAFVMASALAIACVVEHFWRYPDGGADAIIIWNLRARWLFRARDSISSAFSPDILFWTHQDYPLMVPGIVAGAFAFIEHESMIVCPRCIALRLMCSSNRRSCISLERAVARWTCASDHSQPCDFDGDGASRHTLASFFSATIALLLTKTPHEDRSLAAAGAFASMMAWTKNEGALLILLVFATAIVTRRRWRAAAAFALGSAPFVVLLLLFKLEYAPTNDLLVPGLAAGLRRVMEVSRWWLIIKFALRHVFLVQVWSLHLVVYILFLIAYKHVNVGSQDRSLQWTVVITLSLFPVIWLMQPYDTLYVLQVTFDRLVMQLWPAMILLAATRWAIHRDSHRHVAHAFQT